MKKSGFTLIELVVVIVILGILTVIAAPKFLNLQDDARSATLQATKGALESAFQIFSAKAQMQSAEITEINGKKLLTLNGVKFGLTEDYYPEIRTFNSRDLLSIVNLEVSDDEDSQGLIYSYDTNFGFILFYGDYLTSRCFISYAPDKEHNNLITLKGNYFYIVSDGC